MALDVWHVGAAMLLGLTACDRGRAVPAAEERGGADVSAVPAQTCDKLSNAALERAVMQGSEDGSYSRERLLELSELSVVGASSLDGIECMPHLTKLWLSDGSLDDVSALRDLQELETLTVTNEQLRDLSRLPSLPKVRHLDIAQNHITDLASLPALPALTEIYVSANPISSLTALNAYPGLEVVWATRAELRNLNGLALPKLVELHVDENQLEELGDLSQLSTLDILDVSKNRLKDLRGVQALPELESLQASRNPIDSLEGVESLAKLASLDVSSTSVRDLRPLAALLPLQYLGLSGTPLTSLAPLSGWAEGEGACRKLDVTDVPLDDASNRLLSAGFCARNWGVIPTCAQQCFDLR